MEILATLSPMCLSSLLLSVSDAMNLFPPLQSPYRLSLGGIGSSPSELLRSARHTLPSQFSKISSLDPLIPQSRLSINCLGNILRIRWSVRSNNQLPRASRRSPFMPERIV